MARESMMALVTRIRTTINDTGNSPVFTDDDIEATCDQHQRLIWWTVLRGLPTFRPNLPIEYITFVAEGSIGAVESDFVLQRTDYTELAGPSTGYGQVVNFSPYPGRWDLIADEDEPSGVRGIALRLTAKTYDLHAVAGDLLTMWAGRVALAFDFTEDKSTFNRSQQQAGLLKLADYHYRLAQPTSSRLWQGDAAPDLGGGPAITYPSIASGMPIP